MVQQHFQHSQIQRLTYVVIILTLVLFLLGMSVGSTGFTMIWPPSSDSSVLQIMWDIRLPRTLAAWLAGALLGLAGAIAQGLFRNPLADPYLLGSASGATLGVALSLVMLSTTLFTENWLQRLGITSIAFIGALAGVVITVILARGFQHTFRLLLAGVIVGVILAAISSFFAIMHPEILPAMQAFMLGTTSFAGWSACQLMSVVLITCCLVAWSLSKALDALTLGELTAISLGMRLNFARGILVVVLALATGAAVSQVGLIAFVGLAAPHLARSLIKVVHRTLLIYSTLIGGILLLGADILARALIAPQELPVGLLTAILGGSYLLWLMHAGQNRAK